MSTNWALVKSQYELLNHSVEDIARDNNISTTVVEYAIRNKGWQRLNMSDALHKLEHSPDEMDGLIDSLALLKEASLLPQYIAVESAMLAKLEQMVNSAPLGLPAGADIIAKCEKVFSSLAGSQGMLSRVRNKQADEDGGGVKIQIMNRFESSE